MDIVAYVICTGTSEVAIFFSRERAAKYARETPETFGKNWAIHECIIEIKECDNSLVVRSPRPLP